MTIAEKAAHRLSTGEARVAINSLLNGKDDWKFKPNEAHRTRPYPMGFYGDDVNLYYARGWGMSEYTFPWERWLLRRLAGFTQRSNP